MGVTIHYFIIIHFILIFISETTKTKKYVINRADQVIPTTCTIST